MNTILYPIQFKASFHYRIWGGNGLRDKLHKPFKEENIGESWEISTVPNFVSEVENGCLKGKNINDLIAEFGTDFLGTKVSGKFGKEFPLLIKYIDADAPLSVQVHPDDAFAQKHHKSFGKTEMWFIMETEPDAEIIIGFKKGTTKEMYQQKLEEGKLEDILETVQPEKGDVYYIPAGRVHAIGKGITLAEIQQTSDVTYRIYDYNRIDKDGKTRELHTEKALEVSDFNSIEEPRTLYSNTENKLVNVIESPFFNTSKLSFNQTFTTEFSAESFTIYICTNGNFSFEFQSEQYLVKKGETILIPACITDHKLIPEENAEVLMVRM